MSSPSLYVAEVPSSQPFSYSTIADLLTKLIGYTKISTIYWHCPACRNRQPEQGWVWVQAPCVVSRAPRSAPSPLEWSALPRMCSAPLATPACPSAAALPRPEWTRTDCTHCWAAHLACNTRLHWHYALLISLQLLKQPTLTLLEYFSPLSTPEAF